MAGKPKQGLDYAGWATNMFDGDTKIDRLLDSQGWIGFSVYFYLCQMAYKFDGWKTNSLSGCGGCGSGRGGAVGLSPSFAACRRTQCAGMSAGRPNHPWRR